MKAYRALACDYDGTIASDGKVPQNVVESLERLRASGRRVILVTGREFPDLLNVMPDLSCFDRVIAENGAILYRPQTREEKQLITPPPPSFVEALAAHGVKPLSQGRIVVSTLTPYETIVLNVIRDMGLEMTVTFNKGSVMILPSGVNKATGLKAALEELKIHPDQTVAVGDAENDQALFSACGWSAAVSNALPALKDKARVVLSQPAGEGVRELIDEWLSSDDSSGLAMNQKINS